MYKKEINEIMADWLKQTLIPKLLIQIQKKLTTERKYRNVNRIKAWSYCSSEEKQLLIDPGTQGYH